MSKYLSSEFRANLMHSVAKKSIKIIQSYGPSNVMEFVIKMFHFQSGIFLFPSLFMPKYIFLIVMIGSIYIFSVYLYLQGCVITRIEYGLCPNKKDFVNVIDPIICITGNDCTNENRRTYTLLYFALYILGCIIRGAHMNHYFD